MYRILEAQFIAPGIKRFVIDVPRIAKKHQAGQFVILRLHERGERIPITIESSDREKGTIQIVVQAVGKTTYELNALEKGQAILDVVGPLGKPSEIEKYGTVAVLGGGVGTALAYPTTAALKKAGNRILTILGGRNRELVLLEKEMREVSDALYVTTDDGSYGGKGISYGQAAGTDWQGRAHSTGAGGGAGADDESGGGPDAGARDPNHSEPEPDHD